MACTPSLRAVVCCLLTCATPVRAQDAVVRWTETRTDPDGTVRPLPTRVVDMQATAGVPYRIWLCGMAATALPADDPLRLQLSNGTVVDTFTLEDCAATTELVTFRWTGRQTLRVLVQDAGLTFDELVLLPVLVPFDVPGPTRETREETSGTMAGTPDGRSPHVTRHVSGDGNLPPVLDPGKAGFRIGSFDGAIRAPVTLLFTASATGPERADTLTYTWDFGDGSPRQRYVQTKAPSRQNAVHTYKAGGTYLVTVTIADQAGNTIEASDTVIVASSPVVNASTMLKVVQWNVYKGRSTDTRSAQSSLWLQARWLAAVNPDVIVLQEVLGRRMAEKYKAALEEQLPDSRWKVFFTSDAATDSDTAQGVAILTRRPVTRSATLAYARCPDAAIVQRAALAVTVTVNQRNITVIDTHLSSFSTPADRACRSAQVPQLVAWAQDLGPYRIIAGDMNADPRESAIASHLLPFYDDPWDQNGRRTAYRDNPASRLVTRSERIDYLLTSPGAPLDLVAIQVPDTRDVTNPHPIAPEGRTRHAAHNAAPRASDHEMLIATFAVR